MIVPEDPSKDDPSATHYSPPVNQALLVRLCDLLIVKGADPNIKDKKGLSPTRMAKKRGLSLMALTPGMGLVVCCAHLSLSSSLSLIHAVTAF